MQDNSGKVIEIMPTQGTCNKCPQSVAPRLRHPEWICPYRPNGPLHGRNLQPKSTENSDVPVILYCLLPNAKYLPKVCPDSNGIDVPFQRTIELKAKEIKKVPLGLKINLPEGLCSLLMGKSSAVI